MFNKEKSQARAKKEQTGVMVFQFSESRHEVRNVFIDGAPYFVGSDVCNVLGYKNSRKAIQDHCRYVTKSYVPHPQSPSKYLEVSVIPESDVYRLIMKSTLPSAEVFEKWVMEDVLPTLRRRGYYGMVRQGRGDYIDLRNVPCNYLPINGYDVRAIETGGEMWYSINDINKSLHAATESTHVARKLNVLETLAVKIFVYGNTHPAWFTNTRGLQLILTGSRKNAAKVRFSQLALDFDSSSESDEKGGRV